MVTLRQIDEFIASEPIAMVGVSRNPKKFGFIAFRELKERGMNIIPVNPYAGEILGTKAYPDLKSLPSGVRGMIVVTPKTATAAVIKDAKKAGIRQIWIQQNSDTKEAMDELKGTDINYIAGECILMHYKPNGFHKFHGRLKRFFGRFPK